MKDERLMAISPIDGRYHAKTNELAGYFSEAALIKYRVFVEIEYFIKLMETGLKGMQKLSEKQKEELRAVARNFSLDDAAKVKEYEKTTNHDVKAVEYFVKDIITSLGLETYKEFVHFGLTSQDINNTAQPLSLKEAFEKEVYPELCNLSELFLSFSKEWSDIPMLARTHGQPASPTMLGKEIFVFYERIQNQTEMLLSIPIAAKFGGATGNLNAHDVAYPHYDWITFANDFVEKNLGLRRYQTTTQIEHYDYLAAFLDNFKRINIILMDFCKDIWSYISMEYFRQKIKKGEIGSSTMPHKVNPIDFENAEGNLGIANALFSHLSGKLPISRLQRDLTDSTVSRNLGVPIAHSLIAWKSIKKGLDKVLINKQKIEEDLSANWAVVAEAIQTILRREHYPNPYEKLKDLTRSKKKTEKEDIINFIKTLDVDEEVKEELLKIRPDNYTGITINFE